MTRHQTIGNSYLRYKHFAWSIAQFDKISTASNHSIQRVPWRNQVKTVQFSRKIENRTLNLQSSQSQINQERCEAEIGRKLCRFTNIFFRDHKWNIRLSSSICSSIKKSNRKSYRRITDALEHSVDQHLDAENYCKIKVLHTLLHLTDLKIIYNNKIISWTM